MPGMVMVVMLLMIRGGADDEGGASEKEDKESDGNTTHLSFVLTSMIHLMQIPFVSCFTP
mgnify:CR=1 FL=1